VSSKRPSCVKADSDVASFISALEKNDYLCKIVNKGLDALKENMFVGEKIEKKRFPKYYVRKYGVNSLFKLNLDSKTRLVYTLVADREGVAVVVLEILNHIEYNKRFGYK